MTKRCPKCGRFMARRAQLTYWYCRHCLGSWRFCSPCGKALECWDTYIVEGQGRKTFCKPCFEAVTKKENPE